MARHRNSLANCDKTRKKRPVYCSGRIKQPVETMGDPRIELLNSLANAVPIDFYQDDGGERRYYVYAWFHGQIPIYVGKGTNGRWLVFYVDRDYNGPEAHAYVKKHAVELEPFFVVDSVTETAAFAIEYILIGHFRRQSDGWTLFNRSRGNWPAMPEPNRELITGWSAAASLTIPPGTKPLSIKGHWLAVKSLDDFLPSATMRILNDINPWRLNTPGYHFYENVLRRKPSTIGEVLELATTAKIPKAVTFCEVQDHLKWLFTWRNKGVFLEIDGRVEPEEYYPAASDQAAR